MEPLAKLSLYDILTQLISGFLILALFIPIDVFKENSVIEWIFLIIFSYLIGIIYHRSLEWIRSWRLIKWIRSLCDKKKKDEICIFWFWIFTIFTRNYKYAIHEASSEEEKVEYKLNIKKCNDVNIKKYYDEYYSAMNKPAYSTISILETQEAFLRNMTWIVLFYFCCVIFSWLEKGLAMKIMPEKNYAWILLLIIFFLILFARYQTQMKVYKAVWEAGKYVQNSSKP